MIKSRLRVRVGSGYGGNNQNTIPNPILLLPNIVNYTQFHDQDNLSLDGGDNVISVARTLGTVDFSPSGNISVGSNGGLDGVVMDDTASVMSYTAASDLSKTILALFYLPTYVATRYLMGMADRSDAGLVHNSDSGYVRWFLNNSGSAEVISTSASDNVPVMFSIQQRSNTDVSMFYNALSAIATFDPDIQLGNATSRRIGSRTGGDGVPNALWSEWLECSNVLTDDEIGGIFSYWDNKYSLGIL